MARTCLARPHPPGVVSSPQTINKEGIIINTLREAESTARTSSGKRCDMQLHYRACVARKTKHRVFVGRDSQRRAIGRPRNDTANVINFGPIPSIQIEQPHVANVPVVGCTRERSRRATLQHSIFLTGCAISACGAARIQHKVGIHARRWIGDVTNVVVRAEGNAQGPISWQDDPVRGIEQYQEPNSAASNNACAKNTRTCGQVVRPHIVEIGGNYAEPCPLF
jgi:hypothetical protein